MWGPEAEEAGLGGGPPRESLSEDTLPTRPRACPANRFQGWSHVSRCPLPPSEGRHTLWGLHPPTPAPRTRLSASGDKTEPRAQLRWKCQPTCDTLLPRLREPERRREASVSHRQQGGEEPGAPGWLGGWGAGARTLPPSEPWGPRGPRWRARARGRSSRDPRPSPTPQPALHRVPGSPEQPKLSTSTVAGKPQVHLRGWSAVVGRRGQGSRARGWQGWGHWCQGQAHGTGGSPPGLHSPWSADGDPQASPSFSPIHRLAGRTGLRRCPQRGGAPLPRAAPSPRSHLALPTPPRNLPAPRRVQFPCGVCPSCLLKACTRFEIRKIPSQIFLSSSHLKADTHRQMSQRFRPPPRPASPS